MDSFAAGLSPFFPVDPAPCPAAPADELTALRQVIAARPNWAPARFALAQALERGGDWPAAIANFERTIAIKPRCLEAHESLAALHARLGEHERARACYQRALALAPDSYSLLNNLGAALQELGRIEAAIACYERALDIAPAGLEALSNLAAARTKLRQFAAAADLLARAAALHPASIAIHDRLGQALLPLGKPADAKRHFAAALALKPGDALRRLRLDLLGPTVFADNAAIDAYQSALAEKLSAYRGARLKFNVNELATSNCHPPPELAYQGRDDLPLRRALAGIFENTLPTLPAEKGTGTPHLAFFVSTGSEGIFLRGMGGVLARLTPGRFRTTIVCAPRGMAAMQAALPAAIEYLPMAATLAETIAACRARRFDLAYYWEVGTDAVGYFLPFFRLAAVQCTSWGWPVTSGIAAIDYFLSSELLEPADGAGHYSERLIRLKSIPNYYPRPSGPAPQPDRGRSDRGRSDCERFGIESRHHVFVCAQNPAKIQPDFEALAGAILSRDPRGVLLLIEARWPAVTAAIRERFAARWPACAGRLRFVPRMTQADYFALLATADVALDTVHYAGGANSIYDALAVGTPVVTLPTGLHRGRYTLAAYRAMGVKACIAKSPAEYVDLALSLADDPDLRREVSNEIVATRGALFDNLAAVGELEDVFEQLAMAGRAAAV